MAHLKNSGVACPRSKFGSNRLRRIFAYTCQGPCSLEAPADTAVVTPLPGCYLKCKGYFIIKFGNLVAEGSVIYGPNMGFFYIRKKLSLRIHWDRCSRDVWGSLQAIPIKTPNFKSPCKGLFFFHDSGENP